jgi:hypothetical protein
MSNQADRPAPSSPAPSGQSPELPAARTTIVGGRPPGVGKGLGNIPRGIELLVKKAAVDAAFRAALLAERSAAAGRIGLELTPAERVMLDGAPAEQLQAVIARTKVEPSAVPALMGKAAAAMLVALGLTALALDGCERAYSAGATVEGIRPSATATAPPAKGAPSETGLNMSKGIRPDVQGVHPDMPTTSPTHGVRPDVPATSSAPASAPDTRPSRGMRPDLPAATFSAPTSAPAGQSVRLRELLGKLDAADYKDRQAAQDELEKMGKAILPDLKLAQQDASLSAEVRNRVGLVIDKLDPKPSGPDDQRFLMKGLRAN